MLAVSLCTVYSVYVYRPYADARLQDCVLAVSLCTVYSVYVYRPYSDARLQDCVLAVSLCTVYSVYVYRPYADARLQDCVLAVSLCTVYSVCVPAALRQVLESVRLPLLSPYFLHDCVAKQKIVRTSPECHTLLEEAR